MRLLRVALFGLLGVAVIGFIWAVAVWLSERRKREVFPSSRAQMLLNPLRDLVMPVAKTLERFALSSGQTVLEVGPGPGYYSLEASRMLEPTGRLICLDLQRGMLDILRDRLTDAAASNVYLLVADGTHLPFREDSIDGAFLVTVLGEIPDQGAALSELGRVLKPHGILGFSESLGDPDFVFLGRLRRLCGDAGFSESGHWRNPIGYTIAFRRSY